MALTPGSKLGPYEVLSAAGTGGMGEVYKARDTRLDRTVAIKVLPSHLSSNPDLKARFEREAKAISGLQHPNICVLHDIGSQDGVDFLVMEYLEGETLAERILRKPLTVAESISVGIEIADALEKAHKSGIIHRDLKPGNVMLTKSGAKLMDFGLAKPAAFAGSQSGAPAFSAVATMTSPHSPITMAGQVVGTVQYMSPEQIQGKEADARSDIFAFGAVLYEMLTGKRAFEGKSQLSVASAILEKEPEAIAKVQPVTPPALEYTVQTCLAKEPEDRFQNAHDLKLQLQWVSGGGSQVGMPAVVSGHKRNRERAAWGLAAVSIALLGLFWFTREAPSRPAMARFTIAAPAKTWLDVDWGPSLAISPDGQRIAYAVRNSDAKVMLYVRRIDEFEGTAIPGTEGATKPFFSPDSRWIGFFTESRIKKVPAEGGAVVEITTALSLAQGATWGTDGYIYFNRHWAEGLSRVSQDGGKSETLTSPDPARREQSHRWPEMLPDGQHILFSIVKGFGAQDAELGLFSLKTHTWQTILPDASNAHYLPTGHLVYVHAGTLMAVPFDLKSLKVTGTPVPMVHDVLTSNEEGFALMAVSRTGSLVYAQSSGNTELWPPSNVVWVSRDGKETPATQNVRAYEDMSMSPDRKLVAFTIPAEPKWNIWTLDLERGTLNRLTFNGDNRDPLWSPDGKHIAYTSERDGHFGFYWSTIDGSAPEQRVAQTEFQAYGSSYTPDGKKLIFNQYRAGSQATAWEVAVTGDAKPEPLTGIREGGVAPDISPDGQWIAYESSETGESEIYVQSYPALGGKWQVSNGGGIRPRWSPDGKELFFRHGDSMMAAAVTTQPHFISTTPKALFSGRYLNTGRDYETDGKRFLMMKSTEQQGPTSIQVVLNWSGELKK